MEITIYIQYPILYSWSLTKKYMLPLVSYTKIVLKTPQEMRDPLAFRSFCQTHNIDDISKIVELLEPNLLLLWTWSYFGHCQQTARKLEEEVRYQKDSAESLLEELQRLGIDEVLCPLIAEARWLDR